MRWDEIEKEFALIDNRCTVLAKKKNADYGSAWEYMRLPSITDQILIKALRVRQIEENKGVLNVEDEPLEREYVDIINYCRFSLLKLKAGRGEISLRSSI